MTGWTAWLAIALVGAACAVTTKSDYPEDLGSDNYLKRTKAVQEFARRKDEQYAVMAFPLLTDEHITLRSMVHRALRTLSAGEDFGYRPDLEEADRARVARRWQHWWEQERG